MHVVLEMASRARDKNAWSVGVHAWPFARLVKADPDATVALFPNPRGTHHKLNQDNLLSSSKVL
jgi:hypothetical protein